MPPCASAAVSPCGSVKRRSREGDAAHDTGWAGELLGPGDHNGADVARSFPAGAVPDRRAARLHHPAAWAGFAGSRSLDHRPPGQDGHAACSAAFEWRPASPAGGQHRAQAVWTGGMADREARNQEAALVEEAARRHGCGERSDRGRHADGPRPRNATVTFRRSPRSGGWLGGGAAVTIKGRGSRGRAGVGSRCSDRRCASTPTMRKPRRLPSASWSSTGCSISDARTPSASPDQRRGWGDPLPSSPRCNTLQHGPEGLRRRRMADDLQRDVFRL